MAQVFCTSLASPEREWPHGPVSRAPFLVSARLGAGPYTFLSKLRQEPCSSHVLFLFIEGKAGAPALSLPLRTMKRVLSSLEFSPCLSFGDRG